jgi:sugar O-acyltransferase (sialic acid O-acetyltransferase NeuD family)
VSSVGVFLIIALRALDLIFFLFPTFRSEVCTMGKRPLIIVGDSAFAEIAYEYFLHDSNYQPVAFAVEAAYRKRDELFGLPVVDTEGIEATYSVSEHSFFAAIAYGRMNRTRRRLYLMMKEIGYAAASYVSSRAFVWHNVQLGEHCFIFENNVVQPFVRIGNNVILWSGNHVGHHGTIQDDCFVSSHVCIAGFCNIGEACFLGVNASIGNNLVVGRDTWLSPGVAVTRDVPPGTVVKITKPEVARVSSYQMFDVEMPPA